jgi:2'-5' RNA ligase
LKSYFFGKGLSMPPRDLCEPIMAKNLRLFVALQPTEPVRAALVELAEGVAKMSWLKRHRDFAGPAWRVDAFCLMSSELTSTSARHNPVRTYALGQGETPR